MREVQHGQKSALRAPLEACFADGSCFVHAERVCAECLEEALDQACIEGRKGILPY